MTISMIDPTFFAKVSRRIARLINAQPRSPSLAQIEEVVRETWRQSPVIDIDISDLGDVDRAIIVELFRRLPR